MLLKVHCIFHKTISLLIIDIFGELTKLTVDANGLVHKSSQYGVTIIVPEGAVNKKATLWFGVCLFNKKFKLLDHFVPVSPFVWAYIDTELIKPIELDIPHHIDVSNMVDRTNQLFLLTADDEPFMKNKVFTFKHNHEYRITIESTSVKVFAPHLCTDCIAVNGREYREIPKQYYMVKATKSTDDSMLVDFCFLYRQPFCIEVCCNMCINYLQLLYLRKLKSNTGHVATLQLILNKYIYNHRVRYHSLLTKILMPYLDGAFHIEDCIQTL